MPQVDVPNQFGDESLTPEEAASACGPAAAVAFARANGRNPTLREALDLAKRVGWTAAGGMNGIGNQKRLLDAMGIPAELDTNADPNGIRRRVQAGQDVTVSTPVHYYVIDAVDDRGRVHVGQSGLARRGGAEWMTLEDIASRDGGINGALYQTVADTGGDVSGGSAGVDTSGDRPSSEFERPSNFPPQPTAPTRSTRMQTRIGELQRAAQIKQDEITRLSQPGPDEIPSNPNERLDPRFEAQATQARQDRVIRLNQAHQELTQINQQINSLSTDLANDADPKTLDPAVAAKNQADLAKAQVELEQQKLALEKAKNDAARANGPAAQRLADLELKKAELGLEQAQITLENARNPRAPLRAPQTPEEIAQARLNLTKTQQEIDKNARGMLPAAQQVMQGLQDSIDYLHQMYEKGQIELPEMNAYVEMFKQAARAQLMGTTPAEEAAAKQRAKEADQTLGMNLLNQRLVSGTGLAKSLMDSALGPNIMMRPGQTSLGIDPLSSLLPLLNQLGGGADIPGYARGLLLGAQGGAPPPAGPAPAGL